MNRIADCGDRRGFEALGESEHRSGVRCRAPGPAQHPERDPRYERERAGHVAGEYFAHQRAPSSEGRSVVPVT